MAKGKLYLVGLGPGGAEQMTRRAYAALAEAEVICGYHVYVDLVKEDFPAKRYLMTGMTKEVDRCKLALAEVLKGQVVAMISSGDVGVYGMAGIMLEVAAPYPELEIELIPGVTAACSGAALLGAPLGSDCCLISLSDLLTPWEKIEKRLLCAAQGDFCIALYNPASHRRQDYLARACALLLQYQQPGVPCGIVRNIGRPGEAYELTTLGELGSKTVDMFATVLIGNSQSRIINGRLVTPRGYRLS